MRAEVHTTDASDTAIGVAEVDGRPARMLAEQVVVSVAPVDAATLESWWDEVNDAQGSLPLLARVALPTAVIEVRGDGEVEALCQADGEESACVSANASDPGGAAWTRLRIGGSECWVAAHRGTAPVFVGSDRDGGGTRALDAEAGRDGDWHVALVAQDPTVGSLWVDTDGDGEAD